MKNKIVKNEQGIYGVISEEGKEIIPFNYHYIEEFNDTGLYIAFCQHGKVKNGQYIRNKIIFNSDGKILDFNNFDKIEVKDDNLILTLKIDDFKKVNNKSIPNNKRRPDFF